MRKIDFIIGKEKKFIFGILLYLFIFFFVLFFFSSFPFVSAEDSSTSIYNVQYFSPSQTSFGQFSNLMSGPQIGSTGSIGSIGITGEFYDFQVFIPPFGCQPYIVRSDLLEEQNVPVFCKLVPLKINPGIDITRLDSISITLKESNDYVAGVGFHPAQAAIKSKNSFENLASLDNLGYVVVVLKKQPNEKAMPDSVIVNLSAKLRYSSEGSFGIGDNELYVPVLSDEEFSNLYKDYSFFDGVGYVRVEDMNEKGALIKIYNSADKVVFSNWVEKGKTSRDFYIPYSSGRKSVRITLKDITLPEVKAKIRVNGKTFNVYKGQSFYDGKCKLTGVEASGGGTGTATVYCGKSFDLAKKFNKIKLEGNGISLMQSEQNLYGVGEKIAEDNGNYIYLAYVGKIKGTEEYYAFTASISKDNAEKLGIVNLNKELVKIGTSIDRSVKNKATEEEIKKINLKYGNFNLEYINSNSGKIKISGMNINDDDLGDASDNFYKAINGYDVVKTDFGSELYNHATKVLYGEEALWEEYDVANYLGQYQKEREILSRIMNEYPLSKNPLGANNGKTAEQIYNNQGVLGSEGASAFNEKENIFVELLGVYEPLESQASVEIGTRYVGNSERVKTAGKSDVIYTGEGSNDKDKITLVNFNEKEIFVDYNCKKKSGNSKCSSEAGASGDFCIGKNIKIQGNQLLGDCNVEIDVRKINLNKVANIKITPAVTGMGAESEFTFAIGIEKRAISMDLTPEEANKKIEELNREIGKYKNLTESLGKIIEGDKIACMATSAFINIKNLFAGKDGSATARTRVMQKWNALCEGLVAKGDEKSVEECIANKYSIIEKEIEASKNAMKSVNKIYDSFDKKNKDYSNNVERQLISASKTELGSLALYDNDGNEVTNVDKTKLLAYLDNNNIENMGESELGELYYNAKMANYFFSKKDLNSAKEYSNKVYSSLRLFEERKVRAGNTQENSANLGFSQGVYMDKKIAVVNAGVRSWVSIKDKFDSDSQKKINDANANVATYYDTNTKKDYLVVLNKMLGGGTYDYSNIYGMTYDSKNSKYKLEDSDSKYKPYIVFKETDASDCKNACKNCNFMRVFTLEPYKGWPSLLPIDVENGWYVAVKQNFPGLGTGEQKSYFDSGQLNSFWICNVGKNGIMEGIGIGDDAGTCRRFDFYTGDSLDEFNCLTKDQTKKLVTKAVDSVREARRQLATNPPEIIINRKTLKVEGFAGEDVGGRCTDFMSPKECQMIFNVCDPVICPNSRCDFGGKLKVDNVIASGIIGSTVLCLPNFIGFQPKTGVIVPVCLTGISAGINGWVSILESYRDCINDSMNNGSLKGICDEMYSVFTCDFFWKQAGPISDALFENAFLWLAGAREEAKGGGEYLFVKDAWNNAEKSMNYFQTKYGKDSKLAFGAKELTNVVVADVCKSPLSLTYPNNFDAMLEPENPVQFHAYFEENSYTTATVPPTSHYKIYYHIYAGSDSERGHYYQVYLKNAPEAVGYSGKNVINVAYGYVQKGQTVDEAPDFIDVSGFKQLCVSIDGKEECGFKSVSTSFALNYLKNKATSNSATTPVTKESECVNGGHNIGSLLTPNIQQGVEEFVNPELYNQGIIRVCAGKDPGKTTEKGRWKNIGYCDDPSIRCWLDTRSVEKAIQFKGIENEALSEAEKLNLENLQKNGGYLSSKAAGQEINKLNEVYLSGIVNAMSLANKNPSYSGNLKDINGNSFSGRTLANLNEDVSNLDKKIIYSPDRARLFMLKAQIYRDAAKKLKSVKVSDSSGNGDKDVKTIQKIETPTEQTLRIYPAYESGSTDKSWVLYHDKKTKIYLKYPAVYVDTSGIMLETSSNQIIVGTMDVSKNYQIKITLTDDKKKKIGDENINILNLMNGKQIYDNQWLLNSNGLYFDLLLLIQVLFLFNYF